MESAKLSLSIVFRDHSYGWNPAARVPRVVGEEVVWEEGRGCGGVGGWGGNLVVGVNSANCS